MSNLYHDRGIIKWEPFDALIGYQSLLSELKSKLKKQAKPTFSTDFLESLDLILNKAFTNDLDIEISYYEDGFIKNIVGKIKKLDHVNKQIVLKEKIMIKIDIITNLEIIDNFYD